MHPHTQHLQPTPIIDADHETVRAFAHRRAGRSCNPRHQAVDLYYAVRDDVRYNPYLFSLSADDIKASATLARKESWCVPKAALLAACCRAIGIPARLGFADVRNHLSTKRLREQMKTDVFAWHGYTTLYLDGKWVKATPAFNIELCERFGLMTLDFDGRHDSLYHPFDLSGNKHMEYIRYRGEYDDVPLEEMQRSILQAYGTTSLATGGKDFLDEVDLEAGVRTDPGNDWRPVYP